MHELSIAQSTIDLALEAAAGRRIRRVTLEIGELAGVLPDALAFCFDMAAEGTPAQGASLEIVKIAGVAQCDVCEEKFPAATNFEICACGSVRLTYLQGHELNIKSIEVDSVACVSD